MPGERKRPLEYRRFRVLGFGFWVEGFGFWVEGLGFGVSRDSYQQSGRSFELPAVILTSLQLLPCKRVDRLSVEEEERGGERGRDGRERGRRAREGGKRKGSRFELLTHTCRKSRSCSCQANSSSALIGPALAPSPPPFPDMYRSRVKKSSAGSGNASESPRPESGTLENCCTCGGPKRILWVCSLSSPRPSPPTRPSVSSLPAVALSNAPTPREVRASASGWELVSPPVPLPLPPVSKKARSCNQNVGFVCARAMCGLGCSNSSFASRRWRM